MANNNKTFLGLKSLLTKTIHPTVPANTLQTTWKTSSTEGKSRADVQAQWTAAVEAGFGMRNKITQNQRSKRTRRSWLEVPKYRRSPFVFFFADAFKDIVEGKKDLLKVYKTEDRGWRTEDGERIEDGGGLRMEENGGWRRMEDRVWR